MWRTPIGERILLGREWELFSEGLGLLEDQVETWLDDPELSMTGVGVFDRLQLESKLAMLALVGKALHDGDEPCPELTALTEGTFAAVYAALRQFLEVEFDFARSPCSRRRGIPTPHVDTRHGPRGGAGVGGSAAHTRLREPR